MKQNNKTPLGTKESSAHTACDHELDTGRANRAKLMKLAEEYILKNLASQITVEQISGYLNISCSYFSLLFKQQYGETFIEYVNRRRVCAAQKLLETTDKSIHDIGRMVGYSERRYFTRVFHKYTGMKPSVYRESKTSSTPE